MELAILARARHAGDALLAGDRQRRFRTNLRDYKEGKPVFGRLLSLANILSVGDRGKRRAPINTGWCPVLLFGCRVWRTARLCARTAVGQHFGDQTLHDVDDHTTLCDPC